MVSFEQLGPGSLIASHNNFDIFQFLDCMMTEDYQNAEKLCKMSKLEISFNL